ncbi:protein ORANGE, chloroplastic [Senna tora]|uniref:Protein ORANGE, chloroplastic n=1 Tax=Senna tora TaxID=362788 RepID=A0A834TNX7_9FABA|nr:protein ORANGE, chloroplastic [Senna tora]
MLSTLGRLPALSYSISSFHRYDSRYAAGKRFLHGSSSFTSRWPLMALESADSSSFAASVDSDAADKNAAGFCIIEGPETVQDFAKMELQEIQDNIRSRRNKIFLHMEEVRRLRIQQRIKSAELGMKEEQENELPNFPSFIPFLPPLTASNLKQYYATCFSLIAGIMLFGGLLAPSLELKLGLGGTSYEDFIRSMHLPMQLRGLLCLEVAYDLSYQVDPIVASFSGGAVGVISALMVVEINNVKQQEQKRCKYCLGTGYLACARCSNTGALVLIEPVSTVNGGDQPLSPPKTERCSNCSGSGKVMCPTCLCTGMAMASEHDLRIDPFD